jgi:hypothetical protein
MKIVFRWDAEELFEPAHRELLKQPNTGLGAASDRLACK